MVFRTGMFAASRVCDLVFEESFLAKLALKLIS